MKSQPASRWIKSLALPTILLLAAFLRLYNLNQVGRNGLGNTYYAAAVQSMLTGWRNFFFLSVDPAGFIALDKPPLAFWIQAASARLFGFNGLSLLLPGALAGILSVYVLYYLVRRASGEWAGLVAALCLAVSPISVIIDRSNYPDPLLSLALLLAAAALCRAVEGGSLGWLLGSAVLVGVAFNIKSLQLLLVAPGLGLFFVIAYPQPWKRKLQHAFWAGLALMAVALPWALAVELTPTGARPYVGGSLSNSIFELIIGYNGIERLWAENWNALLGEPGVLRFFGPQLAGQVGWLLPLVLLGGPMAVWQVSREGKGDRGKEAQAPNGSRCNGLILWVGWLVFPLVYFSASTFFHRYYLATMAPAVAALSGIAVVALARSWESGEWGKRWVFATLILSAAGQAMFLLYYPAWSGRLWPALGVGVLAAVAFSWAAWRHAKPNLVVVGLTSGLLALTIAPAVWSAIPVLGCTDRSLTLPVGGPQSTPCQPFEIKPLHDPALVAYLEQDRQGAQYMAATFDMAIAIFGILDSKEPWMALGGYRGSDPVLTVEQFAARVESGQVRYFASMSQTAEYAVQEPIWAWVREHCPPAEFQSEGVYLYGPCAAKSSAQEIDLGVTAWPTEGWTETTPQSQGMDADLLAAMFEEINLRGHAIDAVVVVRNGFIVAENYFTPFRRDQRHVINSCTKSVVSALIGIAIQQGAIAGVDAPILELFPDRQIANLDADKQAMTLEHLLTMTSGWNCRDSYLHRWEGISQMRRSDDWIQFMLDLPMIAPPGERFEYCNGASFMLSAIITESTGDSALDYAHENLFGPLGITDVEWPANRQGINIGWGDLRMQPRDMAKIGYLYLRKGEWDGQQIVPADWVAASTTKFIDATLQDGYGYQWWLTDEGVVMALGYAGQFIFVVPEEDLVVVFVSDLAEEEFYTPQTLLETYILPAATPQR